MEKSMIQDLRTSAAFPLGRSTFTTSFHEKSPNEKSNNLRMSKISNLPSYKKSDLSNKLPFIVVFQTMEIERLSEQIQSLRVELKDTERQAFNCQSYQVQIRQLTDQCHNYDTQLSEYKDQVEKLNDIAQQLFEQLESWKEKYSHLDPMISEKFENKIQECRELQREVEKWRNRYMALETSKDKELQDLRLAMENQRQSMIDREIREISLKFTSERNHLEGLVRKLQDLNEQKTSEITNLNYQIQALRLENQANREANGRLKETEVLINRLTDEAIQLNDLLRRKQEQIDNQESQNIYLKQLLDNLEREKRNTENEAIKVPELENDLKEWISKFSRLSEDHQQVQEKANSIPQLESNLKDSEIENQRLGGIIKQKLNDISEKEKQIVKIKALLDDTRKTTEKIPILERKIVESSYENDRLGDQLKARLIEIQNAKAVVQGYQKALKAHNDAEPERKKLQENYRRQVKQIDSCNRKIEQLERQATKIPELERLLNNEKKEKQGFSQQAERLNRIVGDKSRQIQKLDNKVSHLTQEVQKLSSIEAELKNYQIQNNQMTQQIDRLAGIIKQKCEELEKLKEFVNGIQRGLEKYKEIENKLIANLSVTQKLTQELSQTKSELERSQNTLLETQFALREAKNNIIDLNEEKQLVMRSLKTKTQEYESAVSQNKSLERNNKDLSTQLQRIKEQLQKTLKKLSKVEENLLIQKSKSDELKNQCMRLQGDIDKIKIKGYFPEQFKGLFENIKRSCITKDEELKALKRKQSELQGSLRSIVELLSKGKMKHDQSVSSMKVVNQKLGKTFEYVDRIYNLEEENNKLRAENLQLESDLKIANLDLLDSENRRKSVTLSDFGAISNISNTRHTIDSLNQSFKPTMTESSPLSARYETRPIRQNFTRTTKFQLTSNKVSQLRGTSDSIRQKLTSLHEPSSYRSSYLR